MLYILSPTKTMNTSSEVVSYGQHPSLLSYTNTLIKKLKQLNKTEINELMPMSEKLLDRTLSGYKSLKTQPQPSDYSSAVMTYSGEAFISMNPTRWSDEQRSFADQHVRILSGLYGVLAPSDLIQNYRLEMGARSKKLLNMTLYKYWSETITTHIKSILDHHEEQILINLASNEYAKTVNKTLGYPSITIDFKEYKNGKLKTISFNAKKARGKMIDYLVRNRIDRIEGLKQFDLDGYKLAEESKKNNLLFVR